MGKISWYLSRLRAMSPREVVWRLKQKQLQRRELAEFKDKKSILNPLYPGVDALVEASLPANGAILQPFETRVGATTDGRASREAVRLLGGFDYDKYATDWHAGFNTPGRWPLLPSYTLDYKQRDDIGDARINWELNRHRQFTRLAAADDLTRLEFLLDDWAEKNPFLWGISWTSPMEIALRSISWMTAARIIVANRPVPCRDKTSTESRLVGKLLTGAANMTEYLTRHESGFSSANNHLIVEAAAVALSGFLFKKNEWAEPSLSILDRELRRQVAPDGVDRESSLHYHAFVLEAYLLVWRGLKESGADVSQMWRDRLEKMARFIESSRVWNGTWCVFGDDDEARIIDTGFGNDDYFDRLLHLHKELSGIDVSDSPRRETRRTFPDGGYSFLRKGDMYVGIDHAPLGFGSIAAHGHNDILSFQLFVNGRPFLVDSGTYLYHTDLARRNLLRSTRMHNTVTVNGMEQSRMLGPFLWGKKAVNRLVATEDDSLTASVKGLSGVTHTRRWDIKTDRVVTRSHPTMPGTYRDLITTLAVTDSFNRDCQWEATLLVAPGLDVVVTDNYTAEIGGRLSLKSSAGQISTEAVEIATSFGKLTQTTAIRIVGNSRENVVTLQAQ